MRMEILMTNQKFIIAYKVWGLWNPSNSVAYFIA